MHCFRVRLSLAAICLYVSACGANAAGYDFHAKYAGRCVSSDAPFAAGVEQSGPRLQGAREQLVSALEERSDALRRCYVEALANTERLHGRVVLRLTFAPSGGLDQVSVAENETGYEPMACCVAAVASELSLQPSAAGAPLGIEYPFTFQLIRMPLGYREGISADFAFSEILPSGYKLVLDGALYGGGPVR